jgi:hypothetical protein
VFDQSGDIDGNLPRENKQSVYLYCKAIKASL